jgi:glycosyltransferase involved in cell wall biosynthesis
MSGSSLVSVIIPARNSEQTLARAVNSVIEQDYDNTEIIIAVNDSTDDTLKIAKSFQDSRVRVIETKPGIVTALNSCLKLSQGKYVARQDADDEWLPGKLSRQIKALEDSDVDVLGTQMIVRESNGEHTTSYPLDHVGCLTWLLQGKNPIGHPSVIFRSSILEKVGGYWELFPFAEDLDLWMRMLPHAKFSNLQESLNIYNHVPNTNYNPAVVHAVRNFYSTIYKRA